jgi:sulfur-carrier protein
MKILYFAWLRERVGLGEEEVKLPEGIDSVGRLIAWLRTRTPGHEAAFGVGRLVRCAVNQNFAGPDAPVADNDEVAFFPPVTGG